MKALRKLGKGAESVQLCEVEKPIPGPNDLLVKVMAAGICGTDLHILAEEYSHSVPVTLGHEYTGVVEQVGSGVTDFQVGDQVISVSIAYSCGTCHYCRKGDPVHCTQKASIGVNVDGAMAEYMVIPADSAMKVPEQYKGSDIRRSVSSLPAASGRCWRSRRSTPEMWRWCPGRALSVCCASSWLGSGARG